MKNDILADLEQRVKDMVEADKQSGEHNDATPLDYVRWAIEEIENNPSDVKDRQIPTEWLTRVWNQE